MKDLDPLEICEEANRLVKEEYHDLNDSILFWMMKYIFRAIENKGYKVTKSEVKEGFDYEKYKRDKICPHNINPLQLKSACRRCRSEVEEVKK